LEIRRIKFGCLGHILRKRTDSVPEMRWYGIRKDTEDEGDVRITGDGQLKKNTARVGK
jgi:hypothetical protein